MNKLLLCLALAFVVAAGVWRISVEEEVPETVASPNAQNQEASGEAEEIYLTEFDELKGMDELGGLTRYCRIHEIRLGYRLKMEPIGFQLAAETLHQYAQRDAFVNGERTGTASGVDCASWCWSCIGCVENIEPSDGSHPQWDAPVARMGNLSCRVHGHTLSPVAGRESTSNWDSPLALESRMHFPNAARGGHAEFVQEVLGMKTSWLSSCPECEVKCQEYGMKLLEWLGGCDY